MADYKFLQYETLDDGRIVRILLDRPDARNAQNRGLLVELDEAFLRAEEDDACRVVILGGTGPLFSSGHDMGSKVAMEEYARPTRPAQDQRRHPRRAPRPGCSRSGTTTSRTPAAGATSARSPIAQVQGTGVRGRPDAHVGVRPDRRLPTTSCSPTWWAPASACAASSTSPTRGSSGPARPRS